ncbi:MAG: hypothetical protein [Bacteriophage sp.]|nr:MAG: hypothetical protein [Bacteriophage sp.]
MMASAHARLITAVDLTLTVQGDDPDAPIVHEVQGPGGANDIFEVRQDVRFYLQISRIQNLVADIAEKTIIFEAFYTDKDINIINLCGQREYVGKSFLAEAICSVTKSLFILNKMDYYLSDLALDMSAITVTDGKWVDRLELRVSPDDPSLRLPVKRKKLEFHNLAENVSLWNII